MMKLPIEDLAIARFMIDQISDDFKHLIMLHEQLSDEDHKLRLTLAKRGIQQLIQVMSGTKMVD